jgi:hypothetical protein
VLDRSGTAGDASPVELERRRSQRLTGVEETLGDSAAALMNRVRRTQGLEALAEVAG